MKLLQSLFFSCGLSLALASEWVSPISEQAQENIPTPLVPFPREFTASPDKSLPLNLPIEKKLIPSLSEQLGKEGYKLSITEEGITLKAPTQAGLFYAEQTLLQLQAAGYYFPCEIIDYPAFPIRGFMHDTGRNFQTIESLKAQLDLMSKLKLNVFHWHLTDDPAWRVESKKYPVLNDPSKRTPDRDINDTYSYDEIRALFAYAKERHILIIPEIDMPGHSKYFDTCFGFKMHTPKGMDILEELMSEFFQEIPADICPYFHFGADEVQIPNAEEFVKRMSDFIKAHGRIPIQWAGRHDLPVGEGNIAHYWGETPPIESEKETRPYFDSTCGYVNSFEPTNMLRRIFFRQPCGVEEHRNNDKALGTILCLWPDIRVDDKEKISRHSPQWPAIMAIAERAWLSCPVDSTKDAQLTPPIDSEAHKAYALFEKRICNLAAQAPFNKVPFFYWEQSNFRWNIYGIRAKQEIDSFVEQILKGEVQPEREIAGSMLSLRARNGGAGVQRRAQPGSSIVAGMELHSDKDQAIYALIGFDSPARSSRLCSGMPKAGKWSQGVTHIWLNGTELYNQQIYKLAGEMRHEKHTWGTLYNEIPIEDEELWWLREPIKLQLKAGSNRIIIQHEYEGVFQNWSINFIPVKKQGTRWVADESVTQKAGTNK